MSLTLVQTFLISLLLHAALVLFGPAIRPHDPGPGAKTPVEVDLIRRPVPLPEALRPKPLPPVPLPSPLDVGRLLERESARLAPPDPSLEAKLSLPGPGEAPRSRPLPGPPKLNLPAPAELPAPLALGRAAPPGEGGESLALPVGRPGPAQELGGRREIPAGEEAAARLEEELARLGPLLERPERERAPIRGPAAKRRIVFQPPPPQIEALERAEDILLRFWVLPDGTVGRVIPVRKGSAHLEAVAANHLKRWRFSPLGPDEPPREEWGVIAFRFRVK